MSKKILKYLIFNIIFFTNNSISYALPLKKEENILKNKFSIKDNISKKVLIKKYQLKEVRVLNVHKSGVTTISLNENKNILASGSNDGTVVLWDLKDYSYKIIHKICEEITSISFNNKGNLLAIGGKNKKITIYNDICSMVKEINTEYNISSLKFNSNDSILIYTLDNGNIYFYDFNLEKIVKEIKLNLFYPNSMIFDDKKDILFVSGYTNKVIIINLKTLEIVKEIKLNLNENITSISYLNNEKILVSTDLGDVFVLNLLKETKESIEPLKGSNITISSYKNYVVTGGDFTESKLRIFDLKTKNILIDQYIHDSDINSITIYNNAKNIITSSTDTTIKIFNLSN